LLRSFGPRTSCKLKSRIADFTPRFSAEGFAVRTTENLWENISSVGLSTQFAMQDFSHGHRGDEAMTVPDYVAIGVLVALGLSVALLWRGKFHL